MAKIVTKRQAEMIERGQVWGVYAAYDTGRRRRGEIISLHRTDRAAQRQLRRGPAGALGIADLSSEIACGDDIVIQD